jgi:predicted acetyltransferase
MLALRKLTASDAEAFQIAYRATAATDPNFARGFTLDTPFDAYLARLDADERGADLPESYVPTTLYCGFLGAELVGRLTLRVHLNARLRQSGGNIGYVVVPEFRRRGVATQMLRLALPIARDRGLDRALLTCDEGNTGSRRVIEKCGGVLEAVSPIPGSGVSQCRYWISLRSA